LQPGQVIAGKYEVKALIGQGGMGTVYLVRHWDWNLDLAVKVPLEHLVSDKVNKQRFILEAHTWIDLGVHPNIVQCWFVSEWQGVPALFLDYLPAGNLKEGNVRPGEWSRILDVVIQACDGLAHAHEHGLVHRDVKPANLLLREHDRVCVTDFGLVKVTEFEALPASEETAFELPADLEAGASVSLTPDGSDGSTLTKTGSLLGTPEYGAPEQWTHARGVGVGADIYALGVILYELCCGRRPFDDGKKRVLPALLVGRHLSKQAPDPREFFPDVPPALSELVLRCLAKRPDDRPSSMVALREELVGLYANIVGKPYPRAVPRAGVQRADALNNKAVSLWNLGLGKEAFDAWREASKLDALHPETGYNKSVLQWRLGQVEPGEVVRRLTQVKAAYPHAAAYLGFFELERLSPTDAARELELAAQTSRDGSVWRALGDARMALEQFADATQAYQRALEYMPDDGETRVRLEMARAGTRLEGGRLRFPRPAPARILERSRPITAVAVTLDGRFGLLAEEDRLEMFDLATGQPRWSWRREFDDGGSGTIARLAVTDRFVLSLDTPKGRVWSLETGQIVAELPGRKRFYALDGDTAVAGLEELELWPLPKGEGHALLGHAKPVKAVAVNAAQALSGGADRSLRLWDLATGQCLRVLEGHTDGVEAVALTADYGFSGGKDRTVRLWLLASGECLRVFGEHPDTVRRLQVTSDGRYLLATSGDQLDVWDLGSETRVFSKPGGVALLVPDGPWVLVGTRTGELQLRELATGRRLRTFEGQSGPVLSLALSHDGLYALAGGEDGRVRVWELAEASRLSAPALVVTRSFSHTETEDTSDLFRVYFERAEQHMLSGERGLAYRDLTLAREVPGYTRDPHALALNNRLLAVLPRRSLRAVWGLRTCTSGSPLAAVALGPAGDHAVSASGKLVHLWELASGTCVRGFAGHADAVRCLALTAGGRQVVSGSLDGTLRLWDLANGECLKVLKGHEDGVTCLAVTPDGSLAVAGAGSGHLHVWDLASGERLRSLEGLALAVSLTPDGRLALSGPELRLWDVAKGVARLLPAASPAFALTADGRYAVGTGEDHSVRLASLDDGPGLTLLTGPNRVVLTRDGRIALSASSDGTVRVWDAATGSCLHSIEGHEGPVTGVDVTADGRFALSAGADQTLRLWELDWELNPEGQALSLTDALKKPGLLDRVTSLFWKKKS